MGRAYLVVEGFDPGKITDPLYFDDRQAGAYLPLEPALFEAITAGLKRL